MQVASKIPTLSHLRRNGPWKSIDIHGISWNFMNVHEVKTRHCMQGADMLKGPGMVALNLVDHFVWDNPPPFIWGPADISKSRSKNIMKNKQISIQGADMLKGPGMVALNVVDHFVWDNPPPFIWGPADISKSRNKNIMKNKQICMHRADMLQGPSIMVVLKELGATGLTGLHIQKAYISLGLFHSGLGFFREEMHTCMSRQQKDYIGGGST